MANNKLPSYDELPIDSKYPDHTAWGLWGDDDNLGTLNLLTEERITNVSRTILSISLLVFTFQSIRQLNTFAVEPYSHSTGNLSHQTLLSLEEVDLSTI